MHSVCVKLAAEESSIERGSSIKDHRGNYAHYFTQAQETPTQHSRKFCIEKLKLEDLQTYYSFNVNEDSKPYFSEKTVWVTGRVFGGRHLPTSNADLLTHENTATASGRGRSDDGLLGME